MKKLFIFIFILAACSCTEKKPVFIQFTGFTQGTTYSISYYDKDGVVYKSEVDSILNEIDKSASVYLQNSVISRINNNDTTVVTDKIFTDIFNIAINISMATNGAFDITVKPLVDIWGCSLHNNTIVDSSKIDSIKNFTGYGLVGLKNNKVVKKDPRVKLDFSAIKQGYSVDIISYFLNNKGIDSYLIEIGGNIKAAGKTTNDKLWKVGIEKPVYNKTQMEVIATTEITDKCLSTSGNYKNFCTEDGACYVHIINPETGYPVTHNTLSVSVFADNCIVADAYATAFMVMGIEKTKEFLKNNDELKVYIAYSDNEGVSKTFTSEGLNITPLQ